MAMYQSENTKPVNHDYEGRDGIKRVAIPKAVVEAVGSGEDRYMDVDEIATMYLQKRRTSIFQGMNEKYRKKTQQSNDNMRWVRMPMSDYERYWARDERGQYCGTEPEGCREGRTLLKQRLADETMQRPEKTDNSL